MTAVHESDVDQVGSASPDDEVRALFERIERCRPVLEGTARDAERLGTLPAEAVEALREIRIYDLKTPREVGGIGADPVAQVRAFDAIAHANPSAGWCSFTGAAAGNIIGGSLPDKGIDVVFGGPTRPALAGVLAVAGDADPADGGWHVTGKWSYVSGVRHADWISLSCRANAGADRLVVVFPRSDAQICDDWATSGLQGSGSNSVILEDVFVPDYLAWDPTHPAVRGGAITALGTGGNLAPDPVGFALGVARRALDEIVRSAATRRRGGKGPTLAERGSFQHELARSLMQFKATEALALKQLGDSWEVAGELGHLPNEYQAELRALMTYCVETCGEAVHRLWPYLGASELQLEQPVQRCLRDLTAARQHYHVSNVNYESFGAATLAAASD